MASLEVEAVVSVAERTGVAFDYRALPRDTL